MARLREQIFMRIGIFLGNNTPQDGGSFTFVESVVEALKKAEFKHEFYFFYYGIEGKQTDGATNFISLSKPKGKLNNLFKQVLNKRPLSLRSASLKYKIELMWFLYCYEEVDVPFVFTIFDLEHRVHPFFPEVSVTGYTWDMRENAYRSRLLKAAYVISGTEAGKREITRFYQIQEERVEVIPFPTPTFVLEPKVIEISPYSRYNIPSPYLFYPAQFWPHKNHIGLLHALIILRNKYGLDFSLVFTGSDKGNLKYVRQKTEELGITDRVHFLGFVTTDELVGLYRKAFAMVFASFFGPDNIPPLEAFALGCPVIAANVSGAEEQLGNAAILVDPRNEGEFALSVKRIYDEPGLRGDLISRGIVRATKWTTTDYINGMIKIIDEFKLYRRCWSNLEQYVHT